MTIRSGQVVARNLSRWAQIVNAPPRERSNGINALVFNTHISAFFDVDNSPSAFRTIMLERIIPLSLLTGLTKGQLLLACLDTNDPSFRDVQAVLDYLNADYIACDLGDSDDFLLQYNDWKRSQEEKESHATEKLVGNASEAALRREIRVALMLDLPKWERRQMKSVLHPTREKKYWDALSSIHSMAKETIRIHPEYAISKLFDTSDATLTKEEEVLVLRARVDYLVSARFRRSEPKYGGRPVLAAEFDGPVHANCAEQKRRDMVKNKLFLKAGIPYLRVNGNGSRDSDLQPRSDNDQVIDNPKDIHIFLRELIDTIYDHRAHVFRHEDARHEIQFDRSLAYRFSRGAIDWTDVERVVRKHVEGEWGDEETKKVAEEHRLKRIREQSHRLLVADFDFELSVLDEDERELLIDQALTRDEVLSGRGAAWGDSTRERFEAMGVEVEGARVHSSQAMGYRGVLRYRRHGQESDDWSDFCVGPFTVELIVRKEEGEFYERAIELAILGLLFGRLELAIQNGD
jgi:hypothetical protein